MNRKLLLVSIITILVFSFIPLQSEGQNSLNINVEGTVIDNYANITYTLTVPAKEKDFVVSLPRNSGLFLSNATLTNSNTTLWGRVTEAKKAEQIYNETVAEEAIGMLIVPQNSLFEISITNPVDEPLSVSLFVEGMLKRQLGRYSLPIIPSFSSPISLNMELDIKSTKSNVLAIRVEGLSGQTLTQIVDGFHLSVVDTLVMNKVAIEYVLTDYDLSATIVSFSDGETGYFNFFLAPKIELGSEITARQIIFTIDVSGSMAGSRIAQAKTALSQIIATLEPTDQFNIVPFSNSPNVMWSEVRPATEENKNEAIEYVTNLEPLSTTNIYDAITISLGQFYNSTAEHLMILISDGEPTEGITDPDIIRDHARESNTLDVKISTIAIGYSGVESLLEGIALDNNGIFVSVQENDEIGTAILTLFSQVYAYPIDQISFTFSSGVILESLNINLTSGFQTLSNGSEIVVSGKYEGRSVNITANYRIGNETFRITKEVSILSGGDPYAEKMWAFQRIEYLIGLNVFTRTEEFTPQIVTLGIKYGLLVPGYTSMILSELMVQSEQIETSGLFTTINWDGNAKFNDVEEISNASDVPFPIVAFIMTSIIMVYHIKKFRHL